MKPPDWNRNHDSKIVLFTLFGLLIFSENSIRCSEGFKFNVRITKAKLSPSSWCYRIPINIYEIHAGCREDLATFIERNPAHPLNYAFREFYCYCEHYLRGYEMCKTEAQTLTNWCCGRLKCDKYFAGATANYSAANADPFSCLYKPEKHSDDFSVIYKPDCYGITEDTTTVEPAKTTTAASTTTSTSATTPEPPGLQKELLLFNDQPSQKQADAVTETVIPANNSRNNAGFISYELIIFLVLFCSVILKIW